jgi:hypothetical protein
MVGKNFGGYSYNAPLGFKEVLIRYIMGSVNRIANAIRTIYSTICNAVFFFI